MSNLDIWNKAEITDPKYTKPYQGKGGFKGNAINATWLAKQATDQFGPIGLGWGVKVLKEQIIDGPNDEKLHSLHVELWYVVDGRRASIEHFGQTILVGKNKNGAFIDEDAPKKSLTDAMSKALSLLGFGADVHLGLYDDNKYVDYADRIHAERERQERETAQAKKTAPDLPKTSKSEKPAGNVVPMKKADATETKVVDGVEVDDDGVVLDTYVEMEARLKEAIDKCDKVNAVTDLMLHEDTQKVLNDMPQEPREAVRSYAKARLAALGWPPAKKGGGKAS